MFCLFQRVLMTLGGFVATLVAIDFFFVVPLQWFPFLVYVIRRYNFDRDKLSAMWLITGLALWSLSAGPYFVFGLFAALLAVFVLKMRPVEQRALPLRRRSYWVYLWCCLVGAVFVGLLVLPQSLVGVFPDGARLSAENRFNYLPLAGIGPWLEYYGINFDAASELVCGKLVVMVSALILVLIARLRFDTEHNFHYLFTSFVFVAVVFVECLDWGLVYEHLPYVQLRQLFYGLGLVPLSGWLLVFGYFFFEFGCRCKLITAQIAVVVYFAAYLITGHSYYQLIASGDKPLLLQAMTSNVSSGYEDVVETIKSCPKPARIDRRGLGIVASHRDDLVAKVFDERFETRWTTGEPQAGGEVLSVFSEQPMKLSGVVLATGNSGGDFPRGVKVELSNDGVTYREVLSLEEWNGPIEVTSDGVPYWGNRAKVLLRFPVVSDVYIIRITQTASDEYYYWSVSELILYGECS